MKRKYKHKVFEIGELSITSFDGLVNFICDLIKRRCSTCILV
jgi:hypothetical protein